MVSFSVCSTGHVGHLNLDPFLARRLTLDRRTAWPHFRSTGGFSKVLICGQGGREGTRKGQG